METSSESMVCLICFEIIEKPIFVGSDAAAKILKHCNTYLHSTLTKETLKDVQLENENQMPFCKRCFDSAWDLTQLSEQRKTVEKEISDLTVTFSLEVFHRRSQVYNNQAQNNNQNVNKSSVIELNMSCLPVNTFLTKEVHQHVQQLNDKSNRKIIIDNQPDKNIEIINVKFESCDLQLEDLPEDFQPTTSSVDAEILINNQSQDYNQHGVENANFTTALQREVQTTGEKESVDSSNSKDNVRQLTITESKSVEMPQAELKRIQFVDLKKVNAFNMSSCQQKSRPVPQFLNKDKYKKSELKNSKCASSNSMEEKRPKCLYCEKTFNNTSNRNRHHITHTGEKPYKCSFCTKRFAQVGGLACHEKTHTGEKPYKCSFCTKRFTQRGNLACHERTHTGEKPFKCSFCTKRFAQAAGLAWHEKTHTGEKPYKCSLCTKRFAQSGSLACHKRTHTGEKPYKCSFCTKRFSQGGSLACHEKTHTSEKPYKCSFCEIRFGKMCNMKVHERRAHNGVKTS